MDNHGHFPKYASFPSVVSTVLCAKNNGKITQWGDKIAISWSGV